MATNSVKSLRNLFAFEWATTKTQKYYHFLQTKKIIRVAFVGLNNLCVPLQNLPFPQKKNVYLLK